MLIVIPISEADVHLREGFVSSLKRCGKNNRCDALIVGPESLRKDIDSMADEIAPLFEKVMTYILIGTIPKGWPVGCNYYFTSIVRYLDYKIKNRQPWYFFEMDNVPLVSGWAEKLLEAYNLGRKPFMGVVEPTQIYQNGKPWKNAGQHMVGTGIYPPGFSTFSKLWRYLGNEPWDVYLQWEITPKTQHTNLIQHNWGTHKYRIEGGDIVCDSTKELDYGINFAHLIRGDAVVLHGCKDNSLARLLECGSTEEMEIPVNYEEGTPFEKKKPRRKVKLPEPSAQ